MLPLGPQKSALNQLARKCSLFDQTHDFTDEGELLRAPGSQPVFQSVLQGRRFLPIRGGGNAASVPGENYQHHDQRQS
jgi:hypothetical protein